MYLYMRVHKVWDGKPQLRFRNKVMVGVDFWDLFFGYFRGFGWGKIQGECGNFCANVPAASEPMDDQNYFLMLAISSFTQPQNEHITHQTIGFDDAIMQVFFSAINKILTLTLTYEK